MVNNAELMQKAFEKTVDEDLLLDCMRCGFCLPACPTYIHTNAEEAHSPRGRIALMKAVRDGKVVWDASIEESFNMCLGCRACEPACPAGVQYGPLIEQTRHAIQLGKTRKPLEKAVRGATFDGLFANQKAMTGAVNLVRFYQKSGLQKVTRKIGFLNLFPPFMKEMEGVLPEPAKKSLPALPQLPKKQIHVSFFSGCLMDTLFLETNRKTIALLEMLGAKVTIPKQQQCCGALHGHSGEMDKAKRNARANLDVFTDDSVDYIVNNAGGCGAFLAEYDHHLAHDPVYEERAKIFTEKQIDVSSLLVKLGLPEFLQTLQPAARKKITYQDSCHLRNVNGVSEEPRQILKSMTGFEYEELVGANTCCGSAGIYNILQPEMADAILETKMQHVQDINPDIVVTANPGCLMQMQKGIQATCSHHGDQTATHIADLVFDYIVENTSV